MSMHDVGPGPGLPLRVLHIEDVESDSELVMRALKRSGYSVQAQRVETASALAAALQASVWDVVVADYSLPDLDAPAALAVLHQSNLDIPFIIVSGTIDEVEAVTALRAGAHDFITKGNLARLAPAIEREMRDAENRRQRLQAEQQVRFQAKLLDTVGQAVIATDLAGTITYWNHFAEALYGWPAEAVVGRPILEVTPNDASRAQAAEIMARLRLGQSWSGEFLVRRRDGTAFPAYVTDAPIHSDAGELIGIVGISFDISERKRAEAALRRSEANYRLLAENSVQGIAIFQHNRMVYANPAQCQTFGYALEALLALTREQIIAVVHPDDRPQAAERARQRIAGEPIAADSEFRIVRPDGSIAWIRAFNNDIEYDGQPAILAVTLDITASKLAETKIKNQLDRQAALHAIDLAISSSLDLRLTLSVLLDQATHLLRVDAAGVLLLDPATQTLRHMAGRGFRAHNFEQIHQSVAEGQAGLAARERRIVFEPDLYRQPDLSPRTRLIMEQGFVSYFGVPLIAKGNLLGILELFHQAPLEAEPQWLSFLEALASQAAIAIENATLFDGLQRSNQELILAYDATIAGWSAALDLRDKESEGHSQRVTDLVVQLAHAVGLTGTEVMHLRRGALLHDMGKLGIPDRILLKPEPLSPDEWVVMRQHPTLAYQLLSPIKHLQPALDIPYCHHERWDGTGYPRALKGEQIPLAARLFAVVDVWDALHSDRPYRPAWPAQRILEHIAAQAGSHFDPWAVKVFLSVISGAVSD